MSPRGAEKNAEMRAEAKAKIIKMSFQVFAKHGFHATTMKKIANETGMSYGLVYHYFSSKEDLFSSLVDISLEKAFNTLKKGVDVEGRAWDKIKNLAEVLINDLKAENAYYNFLIILQAMTEGSNIPDIISRIGDKGKRHYELLIPLIIEAQMNGDIPQGDPSVKAAAFFSFTQGLSIMAFQETQMAHKITPDFLLSLLKQ